MANYCSNTLVVKENKQEGEKVMDLLKLRKQLSNEQLLEEWFKTKEEMNHQGDERLEIKEDVLKSEILKRMENRKSPF